MLADGIAKCMMADVIAKHVMADVVALWQIEQPHGWNVGRSYCLSDRWNNHRVNYFNFSSLLLLRTSSHK